MTQLLLYEDHFDCSIEKRLWGEGRERRRGDGLGGSGWMLGAWTCVVVVQLMRSKCNLKANKIGSLDSFFFFF